MDEIGLALDKYGKMKKLMSMPEFKELIMEDFVEKRAIDCALGFTGSKDDLDVLVGINQLAGYFQEVLSNGEIALEK